jgi:hypothetical protein
MMRGLQTLFIFKLIFLCRSYTNMENLALNG